MRELANSVPLAEVRAALAVAEKALQSGDFSGFRSWLLDRWGEADPHAALAFAQSLKATGARRAALESIMTAWARTDPDAALAWVESQPQSSAKRNLRAAVIRGLAETRPQEALARVDQLSGADQQWIRNQVLDVLAETDPKAAAELALQHKAGVGVSQWEYPLA